MIPDYFEAITAYRCWDAYDNGLLIGQAHKEPWPPYKPFVARCGMASPHHVKGGVWADPPIFNCDCGIHAYKSFQEAEYRITASSFSIGLGWGSGRPPGRVWGPVKVWGRLIEHEMGYRAEFAYPHELFCGDKELAAAISTLYGVPCLVRQAQPDPIYRGEYYYKPFGVLHTNYLGMISSDPFFSPIKTYQPAAPTASPSFIGVARASRWQRQQATRKPLLMGDWGDWQNMMKEAFHVKGVIKCIT